MLGTDKLIVQKLLEKEKKLIETSEETKKRMDKIFVPLDKAVEGLEKPDKVLEDIYGDYTRQHTAADADELKKRQTALAASKEALTKAKSAKRWFEGSAIFATVVTSPLIIAVAAVVAVVGVVIAIPIAAIYVFVKSVPDTRTKTEKFTDRIAGTIKNWFLGAIPGKIKTAIWDKWLVGGYNSLNTKIGEAEVGVKTAEAQVRETEERIKQTTDIIDREEKDLKKIIENISKLEGSASKKADCILTLSAMGDMGDVGVELLCRSLERLSTQSPAPAWESLTLNLAKCGLTEVGRDRLAAAIASPEANNLKIREINLTGTKLKEFSADKFCQALESNVTITTVIYDHKEISEKNRVKIAKQMVINRYLQGGSNEDLLKEQAEGVFASDTPEEKLASIKAAAEEKVKSHFICEADITIPSASRSPELEQTLKQNSAFVSLMKKPEASAFLEAYKHDSERCLAFIKERKLSILAPEQLDGKEVLAATANKNEEQVKQLLSILFEKPSLKKEKKEVKISIFTKMLAMGNLAKSLPGIDSKIAEAFAKLQASDDPSKIAPGLLFKELRMAVIASGLESSQLQAFNQGIQEDLRGRYDCLKGERLVPFKPESLKALQEELDENYDLVAFEFEGSVRDVTRSYVDFICGRNRLLKLGKSFENKAVSDEEVGAQLIKIIDAVSPEYYYDVKQLLVETFSKHYTKQLQDVESYLKQKMQNTPDMLRIFAEKFKDNTPTDANVAEFMGILVAIKPGDYYHAIEQAGEKNPFAAAIIQKYMISGENPENLVKVLQELKGKNPEAFEAMLKYHLRNSKDPNDKVKLISGLLSENTAYDKAVLSTFIYSVINLDTWKIKSLRDLEGLLDTLKPIEKKRDTSFIVSELSKAEQQQAVKGEPQQAQITESSTNEDRQKDLMARYKCLAGKAGFVDKQSFEDLKKELDGRYDLTKYDFTVYTFGLAPSNEVQKYVNSICERSRVYKNIGDMDAFIKAFTEVNPNNYKGVLEQIGKKDPAILKVVQKYMGSKSDVASPAAIKITITNLQGLAKEKPKAFDALLGYNLSNPAVADTEYKIQLVSGLLKLLDAASSKKLNKEEAGVVHSMRMFVFNITSGAWKNKTPEELDKLLMHTPGIDLTKSPRALDRGINRVGSEAKKKLEQPRPAHVPVR